MISILVLTYNEEINLPNCLASVPFSDDILVFDSNSSDRTQAIAKEFGARVLNRTFDNYGSQRQAALEQGAFKYPWLLVLDADERVDPELARELGRIAKGEGNGIAGFRIRRKDHFVDGHWIPRSTLYPTWHLRFFRLAGARYEQRSVHEHPVIDGSIGKLQGHLLHYSFNKGLPEWLEKHTRYARLEALEGLALAKLPLDIRGLFRSDPGRRRRALKALSYRLPLRSLARFAYMMLIRLAFLDGWSGIQYSFMISRYEGWVQQAMKRIQKNINTRH